MNGRIGWLVVGVVVAVAAATAPGWMDAYHLGIATTALFFVGLASAWNIVGGMAGQFSLGNSLFVASGSTLVSALITLHGWSVWVAMPTGIVCSALLALIVGALMFRRQLPHLSFALVTLALAEVGLLLVTSTDWVGAASGVVWGGGFGIESEGSFLRLALGLAIFTVVVAWLVHRSRLGYRMRAIRDDEPAALAIGANAFVVKTVALVISAVLTSIVATFYANYAVFVDPQSFASPVTSISVILYAVVGGLGTVRGPVIGAAVLYPLEEILRGQYGDLPGLSETVFGGVIILVVLYAPGGISGLVDDAGRGIARLLARTSPAGPADAAVASNDRGPSRRRAATAADVPPTTSKPHLTGTEKS